MTKYPEEGKMLLALVKIAAENYCSVESGYSHVTVMRYAGASPDGTSKRISEKVNGNTYDDAAMYLLQQMVAKGWVKQVNIPREIRVMLEATITKQRLIDMMAGADPNSPVVVSVDYPDIVRMHRGASDTSMWAVKQVNVVDGCGIELILNTREPVSS